VSTRSGTVTAMTDRQGATAGRLTAAQLRVFDELLAIGGTRPVAPASLVEHLKAEIANGTRQALAAWPESTMWVGKSVVSSVLRCEGQLLADAGRPRAKGLPTPTAVGIVVHRAIQMHHTHRGRTPEELVTLALAGARSEDGFSEWYANAAEWQISDLHVAAVNRLCSFLDTFPPLDPTWVPRFEDSLSARLGGLVLSARPDLMLGRPRGDGRQTMFLCDFKSTDLRDNHWREAMFYALVATLRNGVPPFRSCVLSVASGEWTDPDVTADALEEVAADVIRAVNARVEVLREMRPPTLTGGSHCSWCPIKATCAAAQDADGNLINVGGSATPGSEPVAAPVTVSERVPAGVAAGSSSADGGEPAAAAAPSRRRSTSRSAEDAPAARRARTKAGEAAATEAGPAADNPWLLP
jgi:hypothetical protein